MKEKAFQEFYSEDFSHCYGCGTQNKVGYQIKSYWDGDESVSYYEPKPHHTSVPGFVYGGLIASLIDCHSTGTGAAALYNEEIKSGNKPEFYPRCVTASLLVNYVKPTPIDCVLELRAKVKELKGKKVIVSVNLSAKGEVTATGEVVVVRVPEGWKP